MARVAHSGARIAIVTPWFGAELYGGAEQQVWQLAHKLATRERPLDILTTCSASFHDDWSRNRRRAGVETLGDVTVRRFRVNQRNRQAFERVNAILMNVGTAHLRPGVSPLSPEDALTFERENIGSDSLDAYLDAHGGSYDAIVFVPYLYGTTLSGLGRVADRAFLQPCLHDEAYAYLPNVAACMHAARGLLFNSEEERDLAVRLYGPGILPKSRVVGEGVDVQIDPATFAKRVGSFVPSQERYVLYLGRQNPSKNLPTLVHAFAVFRRRHPASALKLVIAGERAKAAYGDAEHGIVDVGVVDEAQKAALLAHCRALAQPSINESYSRVMVEAWLYGRPVLVNEACSTTAGAVRRSNGGFLVSGETGWERALERTDAADDASLAETGSRGRTHARALGAWDAVVERYLTAFAIEPAPPPPQAPSLEKGESLDDAAMRHYAGCLSDALGAVGRARETRHVCDPARLELAGPSEIVVYHGTARPAGIGPRAAAGGDARVFGAFPAARDALRAAGYERAQWLPICVDPRRYDREADPALCAALQDGKTNLVYVGPFRRTEPLRALLVTFLHYLSIEREARLTMIGYGGVDRAVFDRVYDEVRSLNLVDHVFVAHELREPQLQAVYQAARVFVSLDEQATYGEELLWAMWFDIPILARKSATAAEIAGSTSLLLADASDLPAVAALLNVLATDEPLRASILDAQRAAREAFGLPRVVALLDAPAPEETSFAGERR